MIRIRITYGEPAEPLALLRILEEHGTITRKKPGKERGQFKQLYIDVKMKPNPAKKP